MARTPESLTRVFDLAACVDLAPRARVNRVQEEREELIVSCPD